MTGGKKGRMTAFLRIAVSIAILLGIFTFAPVGDLFSRIKLVSPMLWVAVLAGFVLGHALSAAKWRWMIGGAVSYPRALKAHFAGLAANIALPGVAGGDLVRAGLVMKGSGRKTALALGSLADRLIDTASLIVIAAIGAAWYGAGAGVHPAAVAVAAFATIVLGVIGVVMLKPISGFIRKLRAKAESRSIIDDIADAAEEMAQRKAALIGCAVISIAVQFSFAVMNAMIARNIDPNASVAAWVFAWPLAKLIATLPISFGGLGVREASLAGLLSPLGFQTSNVVAASLVWQSIQFSTGGIGALAQLIATKDRRAPAEAIHG